MEYDYTIKSFSSNAHSIFISLSFFGLCHSRFMWAPFGCSSVAISVSFCFHVGFIYVPISSLSYYISASFVFSFASFLSNLFFFCSLLLLVFVVLLSFHIHFNTHFKNRSHLEKKSYLRLLPSRMKKK